MQYIYFAEEYERGVGRGRGVVTVREREREMALGTSQNNVLLLIADCVAEQILLTRM